MGKATLRRNGLKMVSFRPEISLSCEQMALLLGEKFHLQGGAYSVTDAKAKLPKLLREFLLDALWKLPEVDREQTGEGMSVKAFHDARAIVRKAYGYKDSEE